MSLHAPPTLPSSTDALLRAGALPETSVAVLRASREDGTDARDLARLCEEDLSLTSRILAVANSRFPGGRRAIRSLVQAIVVLGTRRVGSLAVGCALVDRFPELPAELGSRSFWRRAFSIAAITRAFLRRSGAECPEDGWLAGFVQDSAVPLLFERDPERYPALYRNAAAGGPELEERERDLLGHDHRELSASLAATWRLPGPVVEALSVLGGACAAPEPPPSDPARRIREALLAAGDVGLYLGWEGYGRSRRGGGRLEVPDWYGGTRRDLFEDASHAARGEREVQRILTLLRGAPPRS